MQTQSTRRPFWWAFALLAVFALLAAGCGSDDSGDDSSSGDGSSDSAQGDDDGALPEKITIAYQYIPNGDLIVKQQGLLEEALPDVNIEWKLFDSGGAVNEAVASGSVDFGLAGSSPVSRGLANGMDYQVIWIHNVIGDAESLVVRDDIEGIEDLAGKKVAVPFASTAHFSLLAALNDAGVDPGSVDIINSEPADITAAWNRGDIDGTYVWNPQLANIIADGGKVLVSSADLAEKGQTTYDLGFVSTGFAEAYPAAVEAWVRAQDQAVALILDDPETASELVAAELDITPEEAAAQIGDLVFVRAADQAGEEYLGGLLAENIFLTAGFNLEQGEVNSLPDREVFDEAVDSSFAETVAG